MRSALPSYLPVLPELSLCPANFQAISPRERDSGRQRQLWDCAGRCCVLGELGSMQSVLLLFVLLALTMCLVGKQALTGSTVIDGIHFLIPGMS